MLEWLKCSWAPSYLKRLIYEINVVSYLPVLLNKIAWTEILLDFCFLSVYQWDTL